VPAACSATPTRHTQHACIQLLAIAHLHCVSKPMRFKESRRCGGPHDIAQCAQKLRQQDTSVLHAHDIILQHLLKTTGKG
jgi:hypothetical protein